MPAKAEWLLRVPEILVDLRALDIPVLDRATIQRLFNFQRRRAIQFMHAEGGYQAGHSFLVDRTGLIAQLEALQNREGFHQEGRRRMRLEETVERVRRHAIAARVKISMEPSVLVTRINALPEGIWLGHGFATHKNFFKGSLHWLRRWQMISNVSSGWLRRIASDLLCPANGESGGGRVKESGRFDPSKPPGTRLT